jgi:hypothetical protein
MVKSLIDTYLQTDNKKAAATKHPAFLEHLLDRIKLHISK